MMSNAKRLSITLLLMGLLWLSLYISHHYTSVKVPKKVTVIDRFITRNYANDEIKYHLVYQFESGHVLSTPVDANKYYNRQIGYQGIITYTHMQYHK
jgi:hypothetical protein